MEKTITIDGKEVRLKTNGATPLRYKSQFKKDYLAEIVRLMKMFTLLNKSNLTEMESEELDQVDMSVVYNIVWVYAKTADSTIPEPLLWLESFDEFPIMEITLQIADMATNSLKTVKKK